MAEYIEREALLDRIRGTGYAEPIKSNLLVMAVTIPAADVRPVVLCKECRHRDPEDHKCDSGGTERQGCPFKVADDYFCAYGAKREES